MEVRAELVSVGAVPLATLKLVDETYGTNRTAESWRHVLIHEAGSKGAHITAFFVLKT